MKSFTEAEFQDRLSKIQEKNKQKKYRLRLKDEKNKLNAHVETSKAIAIYLFILLNTIVIYAMVAMWVFSDLSYLGVLITDIAAQILLYAIYCLKAYKAKKQEEYMKFEREKFNGSLSELLESASESDESQFADDCIAESIQQTDDFGG